MDSELMERNMKESSKTSTRSHTIDKEVEFDQWVTFYINKELFAVDALQVREVLKYSELTPVPGADPYVCGLINLRGKVVTVIDTRLMFSLPHKASDEETNIILVDFNEDEMVGFIVDSVDEVVDIPVKSVEIAPKITDSDTKSGFVKGVSYYNNLLIILLDIKKIITHITPLPEDDLS